MGNSLLDITVFGRRAGESVMKNIPARGAGTLAGLNKFREELKSIQQPSSGTAPLLFPIVSKIKFQLAEKPQGETTTEPSQEKKQFREPPYPFGGM
jgi:succinate dehydrogenase/fumarate reductase flavoprotein subunit